MYIGASQNKINKLVSDRRACVAPGKCTNDTVSSVTALCDNSDSDTMTYLEYHNICVCVLTRFVRCACALARAPACVRACVRACVYIHTRIHTREPCS